MDSIYLDNSATTFPYREVRALTDKIQHEAYGNPSSMHEMGLRAEKIIRAARRQVAALFDGREKSVIFTSGGTEANNLAVKGAAYQYKNRGRHLVTSTIEHPSVLNCFRYLEEKGFIVSYLPVDSSGLVDPEELEKLVGKETVLVSIMHINNEIGSIQPLEACGRAIKAKNPATIFHIDAVQSFGRLPLEPAKWQADLISCSAHKVHGPRGAGGLWLKEGKALQPLLHGGGQEGGLRSGTENTAAIAGFGLAAAICKENSLNKASELQELKNVFLDELLKRDVNFHVNGPRPDRGAPHILNISFPGTSAEILLHSLEGENIYVSAGSACHSRRPELSHVLEAISLEKGLVESALRFSFSLFNQKDDVVKAAGRTAVLAGELQEIMG